MSPRHAAAPLWLAGWRLWRRIRPAPAGSFRILLFHDISPAEAPAFADLVAKLHAADRLIGPAEAEGLLAGQVISRGPSPCLISFDDGFASNLEVARTILDPLGIKALFFVCPGLMDMPAAAQADAIAANIFDGKRPAGGLRVLDWDEIGFLDSNGHAIGSHTSGHLRLTRLSPEAQAEQIEGAAEAFQRRMGKVPDWFAYTFGDIDSIHAEALALIARHHRYCRSGVRGANSRTVSPLALRADHVDLVGSEAWRYLAVEGALDPLYAKACARLDEMAATSA